MTTDATTFPVALAALSAELGAPTWSQDYGDGWHMVEWRVGNRAVVLTAESHGDLYVWIDRTHWLATDSAVIALTPLADAVRDAGAWLRGRG